MSAPVPPSGATVPDGAALVLATRNLGKLAELRAILAPLAPGLDPRSIVSAASLGAPEPVEDGLSFTANAEIKARALVRATGLPAVADDSGLCVDVLGGAPGIFSARWCGRHGDDAANLRLLLDQISDVADPHRTARFTCAAVLAAPGRGPDGRLTVTRIERSMEGRLLGEPRGEEHDLPPRPGPARPGAGARRPARAAVDGCRRYRALSGPSAGPESGRGAAGAAPARPVAAPRPLRHTFHIGKEECR